MDKIILITLLLISPMAYAHYGEAIRDTTSEGCSEDSPGVNFKEYDVDWVGHPVTVSNDPHITTTQNWFSTVEIGLREDGVVVWKEVNYG